MTAETKTAILDAATHLFAERGYEGASLRDILQDANVNSAAAHYHFGSKEAVYRAAIERWLLPLCEERQRSFDSLRFENIGPKERLERLIRAYIGPHLQLCNRPEARDYMRLISRFGQEPAEIIRPIYVEDIEPVRKLYVKALREIVPAFDVDTARRLFGMAVELMGSAAFDPSYESMAGRSAMPNDPELLIHSVVVLATGGILALAEETENRERVRGENKSLHQ